MCCLRCGCRVARSVLGITLIKLSAKWNEQERSYFTMAFMTVEKLDLFLGDVGHVSKLIKCFDVHFAHAWFLFYLRWWTLSVSSVERIACVNPGWETYKVTYWMDEVMDGWMDISVLKKLIGRHLRREWIARITHRGLDQVLFKAMS